MPLSIKCRLRANRMMRDLMAITKALLDPNRVRVLLAPRHGELCVKSVEALVGCVAGAALASDTERMVGKAGLTRHYSET
jgi:DNA-binding transcriptional ArsR family regulator